MAEQDTSEALTVMRRLLWNMQRNSSNSGWGMSALEELLDSTSRNGTIPEQEAHEGNLGGTWGLFMGHPLDYWFLFFLGPPGGQAGRMNRISMIETFAKGGVFQRH